MSLRHVKEHPLAFEIPEGLEHLLPLYVEDLRKSAAELKESGLNDLVHNLHALRGKAAMFGDICLDALLIKAERSAQLGDWPGADFWTALAAHIGALEKSV